MTHRTSTVFASMAIMLSAVLWTGPTSPTRAEPPATGRPFNFEEASRNVPKPREIYPLVRRDMVPMDLAIVSDEVVTSDTDPSKRLRKVTARFNSLEFEGRKWTHPCVVFTPADNAINRTPDRQGKVAIVGSPGRESFAGHVAMYGEPIAARTDYPTMILSSPGIYADGSGVENDIAVLERMRQKTGQNYYNMNCQLALVYIRAMDVLQKVLDVDRVQAVIGGHSKRGRSATVAAAMDPRVAGVVILGNEGVYRTDQIDWHLSFHHSFFQDQVNVPVLYIGGTNECGYKMFNVNLMQERLRQPMTVEMLPNYRHYNFEERQYIDFMMWVAHVFDGRPVTRIAELSHEHRNNRTFYRARIESEAKIRLVRVWYTFVDDPQWNDNLWFDWIMEKRGDWYETSVPGAAPDAFLVEVADVAQGIPGYVTSLPQKTSDAPVVERDPHGAPWIGPRKK